MQDSKIKSSPTKKDSVLKIASEKKEGDLTTVFHKTEDYISKNYEVRFNKLSLDIESRPKDSNEWNSCNDNSLWVEIQKRGIKIGHSSLKSILKSDFVPKFNPLEEYFSKLPKWDGHTDYIQQFAKFVELDPSEDSEQFYYHFKKWTVRAVKCALIDGYFNKQAFVITDNGQGQNMGKSSWCRFLCPPKLSQYIAEDISTNDKDTRILICKNFLINMDELAALSKKEINQLKSLFSKDQINDRLPYDSKNTIIPRVASFLGSTNMSTFLHDETGSVRWLCFIVKNIDWSYRKSMDIDCLWSQACHLAFKTDFVAELTREDVVQNELRNDKFQFLSTERELLHKYFEPSNDRTGEHMTATEIKTYLKDCSRIELNAVQLGKALTAIKYSRIKVDGRYGYYVVKKQFDF